MITAPDGTVLYALSDMVVGDILILPVARRYGGEYVAAASVITPDGRMDVPLQSLAVGTPIYITAPAGPNTQIGDVWYVPETWEADSMLGLRMVIDKVSAKEPLRGIVPLMADLMPVYAPEADAGQVDPIFPPFCDVVWFVKGKDTRDTPGIMVLRRYQDSSGTQRTAWVMWDQIPYASDVYVCSEYLDYGTRLPPVYGKTFLPVHWNDRIVDEILDDVRARTPLKVGFTTQDLKVGYSPLHKDYIPTQRPAWHAAAVALLAFVIALPFFGGSNGGVGMAVLGIGTVWSLYWLNSALVTDPAKRRSNIDKTVKTANQVALASQAAIMVINPDKRNVKNATWLGVLGWAAHASKKTQTQHEAESRDRMR